MLSRHLAAAIVAALLPITAAAQLIKCAGPEGRVTYSDRPCQAGEKRAEVTAAPLPEPTAREIREAQLRQRAEVGLARELELRRAVTPVGGVVGISPTPDRGRQRVGSGQVDRDRCYGVRREIRIAKRLNPMGFDRDIATIELQRAERQFCDN